MSLQLTLAFALFGAYMVVAQQRPVPAQIREPAVHHGPVFRAETKPPATTSVPPKPTPPPIDCSIREDGFYLPAGIPCSRLYFNCAHGVSRHHWCPDNTVFNTEKNECDFYSSVKECPPVPKLTPKPTTPKPTTRKPTTSTTGSSNSSAGTSARPQN